MWSEDSPNSSSAGGVPGVTYSPKRACHGTHYGAQQRKWDGRRVERAVAFGCGLPIAASGFNPSMSA